MGKVGRRGRSYWIRLEVFERRRGRDESSLEVDGLLLLSSSNLSLPLTSISPSPVSAT